MNPKRGSTPRRTDWPSVVKWLWLWLWLTTDTVATKLATRPRQIYSSAITGQHSSTDRPAALAASAGYLAAARRSQPATAGKILAAPQLTRPPTQLVSSDRQYPSRCPTSRPAAAGVLWHFGSAQTALFRAAKSRLCKYAPFQGRQISTAQTTDWQWW
jgi:hypothetical protein